MGNSNKGSGKPELLAPAGNREAFYGAVHAGADAIYLGGEKFGARAYADNFSGEELAACIRYGHIHGCKSYLTVNTLMKEQELWEMVGELKPLYEAGLDGVIVQDIGALRMIRRHFPGLELHASTQMTITGPAGAKLLKELGVTRVVPARELSLQELTRLKEESGLEVEAFVHGAMCYCYSGACLFSSLLGGRSGNRGRCAQPCRQPYETDSPGASVHREEYYPLSLKDMCTIERLPQLIEGGIDSFKIEGRMKKPEYAAGVTAIYRKYIDRFLAAPGEKFFVEEQDLQLLSKLYIRSRRQDGYFFRHNGREMVTLDSPSYAGSNESCLEQIRQRYILEKKRIGIGIEADFVCGSRARIRMESGNCRVEVTGGMVEPAQNRPVLEADIRRQLRKLGETCFAAESLVIHTDEKGFYSLKEINALRREAVRQLEDQIIADYGLPVSRKAEPVPVQPEEKTEYTAAGVTAAPEHTAAKTRAQGAGAASSGRGLRIHISTEEQLLYLAEHFAGLAINRLYVESHLFLGAGDGQNPAQDKRRQALERLRRAGISLWAALPYVLRDKDREIMEQAMDLYLQGEIQGFLARSLEEYGWLHQRERAGLQIQLDHTVYVWNSETAAFWKQRGCGLTCPLELNGREWSGLRQRIRFLSPASAEVPEKLVYGRIPMMVTANCIAKTAGKCLGGQGCRAQGTLTDRYRAKFPVEICCDVCMNVIYNSVPLSLHKELEHCREENLRLSFTLESGREMGRTIAFFAGCAAGNPGAVPYKDYTTGHEKKGVL